MTTKHTDVDGCPVPDCEQEVTVAFATTEPRIFNIESFEQERICIVPGTLDDQPAVQVIYHKEVVEIEDDAEDVPDRDDLEGDPSIVYRQVIDATAGDGEVELGHLKGKCLSASIPPDEVGEIAADLVERGYLDEVEAGVYRPRA